MKSEAAKENLMGTHWVYTLALQPLLRQLAEKPDARTLAVLWNEEIPTAFPLRAVACGKRAMGQLGRTIFEYIIPTHDFLLWYACAAAEAAAALSAVEVTSLSDRERQFLEPLELIPQDVLECALAKPYYGLNLHEIPRGANAR